MAEPTPLKPIEHEPHEALLETAIELLEGVRSGEITAVAVVKVGRAGKVSFERVNPYAQFHELNSGVTLLSNMLASERN